MKKSVCFILTAFVAGCQLLSAQSNKNDTIARRNVVIERNYIPTIKDVQKIDVAPTITEPELKKSAVTYSDQITLLKPEYEINKWQAAAIHLDPKSEKKGYALLGFGIYGTALGDLFYPIVDEANQSLTFDTHILGLFGNKQQQLTTNFGLNYLHRFDNFDINVGTYFKRNGFNYYGTNGLYFNTYASYKDTTNSFVNFGLKVGIRSKGDPESVAYSAYIQYNNFTPGTGLKEQQVHTTGNVEMPIDQYRIGVDLDIYNFMYASYKGTTLFPSHSIIGVNPYFGISGDEWKVRIGLKDYFSINGTDKTANISPDVSGQINLIKTVTAYAGITGQYTANSMQRITDENAYINPTVRVQDSFAPFEAYGGIKFAPFAGLLINGSLDYKMFRKQNFYVNDIEPLLMLQYLATTYMLPTFPLFLNRPTFNVEYDKANLLTASLKANYNYQDKITTHFSAQFNNWETKTIAHAWMRPSVEIEAGSEVKITRNVFLNANYYYAGGRYALVDPISVISTRMSDINDLSLGASYSYSDWLTAFVRLNNALATKYQTYYGYDAVGLNWQIGAAVKF